MPLSSQEIASNIVTQLQLLDPAISAETGTPERKIIEAVSETIAAAQVDFSVLDSQFDLNALSGGTLDTYLGNFGFARQQAVAASGIVTFSTTSPSTSDILIPQGTQVNANVPNADFPDLTFVTIAAATLSNGTTGVDVAVQCTTPGTVGNVPANSVTGFSGLQSVPGITSITNNDPMTGGVDLETDAQLKVRFQNTLFRNMAGTYDQFMALAVAATNVSKANVIGPVSRYQEYVQVPSSNDAGQKTITVSDVNHSYSSVVGGYDSAGTTWPHKRTTAASRIPYAQYVYDNQFYVTDGNLGPSATFLSPFVHYAFNRVPIDPATASSGAEVILTGAATANQPNFTFLNIAAVDNGAHPLVIAGNILLTEFAYISSSSRNNFYKGILNAVDIFVDGSSPQTASSQEVMPGTSNVLQNGDSTKWTYNGFFARVIDGRTPGAGHTLIPLYWQPVIGLPNSMTISDGTTTFTFYLANFRKPSDGTYWNKFNGTTYSQAANYCLVQETQGLNNSPGYYGTVRARNGIEFLNVNGFLPSGTQGSKDGNDASFAGHQFIVKNYLFDANISNLQALMEKNKQITTDVLVHKAKLRYFKLYVNIMYTPGITQSVVNAGINAAMANFFDTQFYGAAIQMSDLLQTIHNVNGVDNVNWSKDSTNPPFSHRVEEVFADGTSFISPTYHDTDFYIQDNQLAASPTTGTAIQITVRSGGTW